MQTSTMKFTKFTFAICRCLSVKLLYLSNFVKVDIIHISWLFVDEKATDGTITISSSDDEAFYDGDTIC